MGPAAGRDTYTPHVSLLAARAPPPQALLGTGPTHLLVCVAPSPPHPFVGEWHTSCQSHSPDPRKLAASLQWQRAPPLLRTDLFSARLHPAPHQTLPCRGSRLLLDAVVCHQSHLWPWLQRPVSAHVPSLSKYNLAFRAAPTSGLPENQPSSPRSPLSPFRSEHQKRLQKPIPRSMT